MKTLLKFMLLILLSAALGSCTVQRTCTQNVPYQSMHDHKCMKNTAHSRMKQMLHDYSDKRPVIDLPEEWPLITLNTPLKGFLRNDTLFISFKH